MIPSSGRTAASEEIYQLAKKNGTTIPLQEEKVLIPYTHWILIANRFPYDAVFTNHDMIIPRRLFAERKQMTLEEEQELRHILDELSNQYDITFENFPAQRSVKNLFHLHLARWKKR